MVFGIVLKRHHAVGDGEHTVLVSLMQHLLFALLNEEYKDLKDKQKVQAL